MDVQVTTLDNGLRVVTDPMPNVETASVGAWIDVGTRHEKSSVNGISHFLEHMAFKGTKRRSAYDIAVEIEAVGGYLNAYTSRENTAYYAKVLKSDTPLAVNMIADILQNSTMDAEEFKKSTNPTTPPTILFSTTFKKPLTQAKPWAAPYWARLIWSDPWTAKPC
jgi:predicted Zn-dependent peptidase